VFSYFFFFCGLKKNEKSRGFLRNSFRFFEICFFLFWFSRFAAKQKAKQKRTFLRKSPLLLRESCCFIKTPFFFFLPEKRKWKMEKKASRRKLLFLKNVERFEIILFFAQQKGAKKSVSRIVGNSKWYMFFENLFSSNFKKKLDRFQFSNFEYIRVFFFFLWLSSGTHFSSLFRFFFFFKNIQK
jgi:hypothetical protein